MNPKEFDREEFQKQYLHSKKKQKFALDMLKKHEPERLDIINVDQKELIACSCPPEEYGRRVHKKDCSERYRLSQILLKKRYIDYKTEFNYYRDYSPEWSFARQIEKEIQFKVEKNRLKQQILKGKKYMNDQFY